MIWFRSVDQRWPFLWEVDLQPPGRWHGAGEGPAAYLADTPDGAWAEFLRHEEITDASELGGIERSLWALDVPDQSAGEPLLSDGVLHGGTESYTHCQEEARRLRRLGFSAIEAPSAALLDGGARGENVRGGLVDAGDRDGRVLVLFGEQSTLRGWLGADGRPRPRLLPLVRPLR